MPVINDVPRIQYDTDGSGTTFPYPSIIYFATELTVYLYDEATNTVTTAILNSDYTIDPSSLGNPNGVNVVFTNPPADGLLLTIYRLVPFSQTLQLIEGAAFPSVTGQRALDELAMQIQQLQDAIGRVPLLPPWVRSQQTIFLRNQDLLMVDTSAGATLQAILTPGNYKDFEAGIIYIPLVGGIPIINIPSPVIPVSLTNRVLVAACPIDPNTSKFTGAPNILALDSLPVDSPTVAYDLISNFMPFLTTVASIQVLGGGVSSSRGYSYCGNLPAVDGSGHLFNS